MSATEKLIQLDPTKSIELFGDGTNSQFHHSDMDHFHQPTGISVEEGDFLYGIVRILRPLNCLETGSNIGVSASFICLALRDNRHGSLVTIEHSRTVADVAHAKLTALGFTNFRVECRSVADYTPDAPLDFLWLDTELNQRFAELLRFFPLMSDGAVACIHDLPRLNVPEFGPVPDELRALLDGGKLAMLNFNTPHGVTVFQKRA